MLWRPKHFESSSFHPQHFQGWKSYVFQYCIFETLGSNRFLKNSTRFQSVEILFCVYNFKAVRRIAHKLLIVPGQEAIFKSF